MTRGRILAALPAALVASFAGMAQAQSTAQLTDALSGPWYVFDPAMAAGASPCSITLEKKAAPTAGRLAVTQHDCASAAPVFTAWSVEGGVLVLFDAGGKPAIELGGNQRRMSGTISASDSGMVLERAEGDGNSQKIAEAVQRHRCYFVGLTSDCATAAQLGVPAFGADPDGLAEVELLADLKVRNEPRRDAPVMGTVQKGTCVRVNQCLTASDGVWCRARFGETVAWLPKVTLRQSEWAVTTFRNECPKPVG